MVLSLKPLLAVTFGLGFFIAAGSTSVALAECTVFKNGKRQRCDFQAYQNSRAAEVPPPAISPAHTSGLQVHPEARLSDIKFRSSQQFLETWRGDTKTILDRAMRGLPSGKLASLTQALSNRVRTLKVNLAPSQAYCRHEDVIAVVRPNTSAQNQMYACPTITNSNWQEGIQAMIHEMAHHEVPVSGACLANKECALANECKVTSIESGIMRAAGLNPIQNGYYDDCLALAKKSKSI